MARRNIMKHVMFYESGFEHSVPDLAFYGTSKIGDTGYAECGAHMHRHIELQLLLNGSETFFVDGQNYVSDGNFIFIFPYQIHANHLNPDCQHISAAINPNAFTCYTQILTTYRPLSPSIPLNKLPAHFDGLIRYANDLYFDRDHPNRELLLHDAMSLIIGETLSAMTLIPRSEDMSDRSLPTIGHLINYCVSHISEDLSLSSVADALYLNKHYISKLFSSKLNMTFIDFITNQRIHAVCERLTSSSDPIIQIAYECGFRNLSNFNRIFRKYTAMTPREYRNANFSSH